MGIEPTARCSRAAGFEDQGSHQAPIASGALSNCPVRALPSRRIRAGSLQKSGRASFPEPRRACKTREKSAEWRGRRFRQPCRVLPSLCSVPSDLAGGEPQQQKCFARVAYNEEREGLKSVVQSIDNRPLMNNTVGLLYDKLPSKKTEYEVRADEDT